MKENQNAPTYQNLNLDKINENLLDILSLLIVLENDMETQKSDNVHLRLVKMVHDGIKNIQNGLPKTYSPKE